jgi:EAL domain-containing protein (putative c-di-GMP-specific phosphodiesterase class I)
MCNSEDVQGWYLEGWVEGESVLRRYGLDALPARIGRQPRVEIHLDRPHVSTEHAKIYARDGALWLRDLGSRNGTFVNGKRVVSDPRLECGDIVQLGCSEFELGRVQAAARSFEQTITFVGATAASAWGRLSNARALQELLCQRQVTVAFQPLVDLRKRTTAHFEILGRGNHPTLPRSPSALFAIAEDAALSLELSRLFCTEGLRSAATLPTHLGLFLNSHPKELADDDQLIKALQSARASYPDRALTLEVHEASLTDPVMMRELRARLRALDIGLAYDDFGAGQARLLEIAEAPPDYLKFDISLIQGLDTAPPARQQLVASLVEIVHQMDVFCVAEGIERAAELTVCTHLGFDFGQGYYLGEPKPMGHGR